MTEWLWVLLLTLLPFLELRASIPYGIIKAELPYGEVFLIAVVANVLLAFMVWFFVDNIMGLFLRIDVVDRLYKKTVAKVQRRANKYVEKYGVLGLALFIGIPLPGSGVYSGALGGYFLGFRFRDYFIASVMGVLIAGVLVTLASLIGNGFWRLFLKI